MEQLDYDLLNFENVLYLKDQENIMRVYRKYYYNNAMIIKIFEQIDLLIQQLSDEFSPDYLLNTIKALINIQYTAIHINLGIGDSAIRRAQFQDSFDYSKHYHPSNELNGLLRGFIDYWTLLSIIS
jgi:hypothetical protein